jgi:hypothetical protein
MMFNIVLVSTLTSRGDSLEIFNTSTYLAMGADNIIKFKPFYSIAGNTPLLF